MKPDYKFDDDIWNNPESLMFRIKYMMRNEKAKYLKFKKFLRDEYDWEHRGPATTMKYEYLLPAYFDFINRS